MDSREFGDWMAFYRIHPFGEENLHAAQQLAMFYNANRGKGKPEMSADDFILKFDSKQENVGAQVLAAFGQMKSMANGKDHLNR